MIKNYFKIALRNLMNNKGYSFINIFGLAVGMAVALLIGLWVRHELSFDGFNTNRKQIGIIEKKTFFNNQKNVQAAIMLPLYDELKSKYPQVKHITRVDWGDSHSLKTSEKKISKNGNFADPDILKIFSFPLIQGNIDMVLKDPLSIVLTESTATALFGQENPIGKTINIDNQYDVNVTGIVKDIPKNSSVQFDFLMPYEQAIATSDFIKNAKTQWRNNFLRNIVELKEGVSMEAFSKSIEHIVQEKVGNKEESALFIHPMEKWHLYDEFKDWKNTGGRIEYVRLFAIIGFLVLCIACINFMNLSTARSEKRAKEVGIRKAIGSQRKHLIVQFLGESMLTAFLAFVIALLIVQISLPYLSDIGFRNIKLDFNNLPLLITAFAGCVFTGLLAGSYPALYLSGFNAIKVLKGSFKPGRAADLPRRILVVTQFSFSIALIIGTVIVFQQIQHAKERPLGYNPDKLLAINLSSDLKKNFDPLKKDLLSSGYVEAVTRSSSPMTNIYNQWDNFSWDGKDPNSRPLLAAIMVDYDYDIAAGIKMKQGRFFSKDFATDSSAVIINETTLKLIGYKDPIGKSMKMGDEVLQIVGVSQDVLMQDPFKPVMPAVMLFKPDFIAQGIIRLKQNADIKGALTTLQPLFAKHNPSFPFEYRFVDEDFDRKFRAEKEVAKLSGIFSVLTIFISCLGLFGLAAFMAERRNKEIGVRKVLGASVSQIWVLLSKDFLLLVAISCALASPIAYWFLQSWLEKYEYRVDISPLVFFATAMLAITITIVTISYHAVRSAKMNPVKSLRTE